MSKVDISKGKNIESRYIEREKCRQEKFSKYKNNENSCIKRLVDTFI
jgi:hypothetical protein